MAEICEWKSDTSFDDKLERIDHYKTHREMLPFIGTQYNQTKILLVGESHYIKDISSLNSILQTYYKENWYHLPLPNSFPNAWWFQTRTIVHNFLSLKRSKAHSMFRNPSIEILKAWKFSNNMCDSDALNTCAFMNYFQRPASSSGETIKNDENDNCIAFNTLNAVIGIIGAKSVIFLSKKAYECYVLRKKLNKNGINNISNVSIDFVNHPTCSHWYSENGKEKFSCILSKLDLQIAMTNFAYCTNEEIEDKVKNTDWTIVKRKLFEDNPTFQAYIQNKYVKEVVLRFLTSDKRRIGIGYRFDYRLIWVWDYDIKEYIESSMDDEITDFYNQFIEFIKTI